MSERNSTAKHKSSSPASGRPRPVATWRRVHDEAATLRQSPTGVVPFATADRAGLQNKGRQILRFDGREPMFRRKRADISPPPARIVLADRFERDIPDREKVRALGHARASARAMLLLGGIISRDSPSPSFRPLGLARRARRPALGFDEAALLDLRAPVLAVALVVLATLVRAGAAPLHTRLARHDHNKRESVPSTGKFPMRPLSAVPSWTFPAVCDHGFI